ncbi:alpha/beta hydrolase family protein [Sphingobacterium lactis]|uniref:Uncharacterized protein n=1 Tax=Sphingobacterium lactis TaxID=797291 RepID=A0A1H6BQV8_9SPHI|nr:hypothetical protein [Sphingobacterium lactis]SEG63088.1 hypothetical protein SAMN05421877_11171 [Sphingobacterium lactis]
MESKVNQLAPIDDFETAFLLGQYAYENGFRGVTFKELYQWIKSKIDLTGLSNTAGLPETFPLPGSTLSEFNINEWTILGPGTYNKVVEGTITIADDEFAFAQFDGLDYSRVLRIKLPDSSSKISEFTTGNYSKDTVKTVGTTIYRAKVDTSQAPSANATDWEVLGSTQVIEVGNQLAPTSDATYKYVDPIYSALVEPKPYQRTRITLNSTPAVAGFATGVMFTIAIGEQKRFKVVRPSVQGNRFRIGYFTDDPIALGSQFHDLLNDTGNTVLEHEVEVPETAKHLGVYLSNESSQDINALDLDILALGKYMSKETFIVKNIEPTSNNLFNKADILLNHDVVSGVLQTRNGFNMSHPIPVVQGESYTVVGKTMSVVGRNLYFFKNANDTTVDSSILGGSGVSQTFISPITGFVRTLVKDSSFTWLETLQINPGSVALPYQPWSEPIERDVFNPEFMPETESKSIVKNVIVDMARGSVDSTGLLPAVQQDKAWKDAEFHKNFRTPRYLNLKGKFSINKNELTAYNVYLHQYDDRFAFISRTLLTGNEFKCDSRTEYVKLHVNRTDSGVITSLPSLKINGKFSGDVYTMNNNETGNNVMSFMVNVTTNANGRDMLDQGQANGPAQYDANSYYTHGIIRLPKNYDPKGTPVRLIYFAHSSAGTQLLDFYAPYKPYVQYLLDEGYAVFDMFSWSSKYPGVTQYTGCPDNSACSQSVYNYIIQNFNVRADGVHLFGKSQGGVQVGNIQYTTSIPVKSKVFLAATPTPFGNNFGYTNVEKEASMRSFGVEGDVSPLFIVDGDTTVTPYYSAGSRSFLLQHAEKFVGYVSCWCGVLMDTPEEQFPDSYKPIQLLPLNYTKIDHVPSKAFCAPDDSWIYQHLKAVQKWTRKGGGIFEFRDMPTGSGDPHHTTDTAGPFVNVQTKLGGVLNNIPVAWVEMLQFFKRFD